MINYNTKMEEQLASLNTTPKLLLHSCCGPCSTEVIALLTNYFDITVYFFNPNIYPEAEYDKRKQGQIKFIKKYPGKNKITFLEGNYNPQKYYDYLKDIPFTKEGGTRCHNCYLYRMENTAIKAKELGYDYFTTTLSVSPYKNSAYINEIGEKLASKYRVLFLYNDFKKKEGYKKSINLSKEYNLYRQDYCGCSYSFLSKKSN